MHLPWYNIKSRDQALTPLATAYIIAMANEEPLRCSTPSPSPTCSFVSGCLLRELRPLLLADRQRG